ncbi:chorion class high-cysteine HCB protein 13-like [Hibiscus syriacus]|uniref:chorion class high-cysteine HCB protein 13-like n=1 Tax=Hibiscus syriacus TaxID=106335 RepID=UPI001923585A|nr:chorion class high-cysteine HCB protein 13-like [Hibiscus syriacus]
MSGGVDGIGVTIVVIGGASVDEFDLGNVGDCCGCGFGLVIGGGCDGCGCGFDLVIGGGGGGCNGGVDGIGVTIVGIGGASVDEFDLGTAGGCCGWGFGFVIGGGCGCRFDLVVGGGGGGCSGLIWDGEGGDKH